MTTVNRVGRAVSIRGDAPAGPVSEMAAALVLTMAPRLREWRAARASSEKTLTTCRWNLSKAEADLATKTQEADALEQSLKSLEDAVEKAKKTLSNIESEPWSFLRFIWMWIWGGDWRTRQDKASKKLREASDELDQMRGGSREAFSEAHLLERRAVTARREVAAAEEQQRAIAQVPRVVSGISFADYPFILLRLRAPASNRRDVAGSDRVLVTEPSAVPMELLVPEFTVADSVLNDLDDALVRVGATEVLADPGSNAEELGNWGGIFGRESSLIEAARSYGRVLSEFRPARLALRPSLAKDPVISDLLARAPSATQASSMITSASVAAIAEQKAVAASIGALLEKRLVSEQARFTRLLQGREVLAEVGSDLNDKARQSRVVIDRQLQFAIRNGELTRYVFFCPLCNASPRYLEREFKFKQEDVERLATDAVWGGLQRFQAAHFNSPKGKRFDDQYRSDIEDSWRLGLEEMRGLERTCRYQEVQIARGADGTKDVGQLKRDLKAHRRAYSSIVRWFLRHPFEGWQGGVSPVDSDEASTEHAGDQNALELQRQSKLSYIPAGDGSWRCLQCGQFFSHATARLGAIDRVRLDILYPLIHTLWNHESIWSKKVDLIKDTSREVRDRLVEEISALQPPINQFLDDTRQLRLQLQEAYAHGQSTLQRLQEVAAQYAANQLLDDGQLEQLRTYERKLREQLAQVDEALTEANASEDEMQQKLRSVPFERPLPVMPERRWIAADAARGLMPLNQRREYRAGDGD